MTDDIENARKSLSQHAEKSLRRWKRSSDLYSRRLYLALLPGGSLFRNCGQIPMSSFMQKDGGHA